ncbi:MAG: TIGR00266 family protein [Spirulinaceae cyanobacterium]
MTALTHRLESATTLRLELQPEQAVWVAAATWQAKDTCIHQSIITLDDAPNDGLAPPIVEKFPPLQQFTAEERAGCLYLTPDLPGELQHYVLEPGRTLLVQSASLVAAGEGVALEPQFPGMRNFFNGEALMLLRLSGTGDVWFNAYGGLVDIPVTGNTIVETGYVAAFEDCLNYQVEMLGGLSLRGFETTRQGGEGLVCRFRGEGRLWIQARNRYALTNVVDSLL